MLLTFSIEILDVPREHSSQEINVFWRLLSCLRAQRRRWRSAAAQPLHKIYHNWIFGFAPIMNHFLSLNQSLGFPSTDKEEGRRRCYFVASVRLAHDKQRSMRSRACPRWLRNSDVFAFCKSCAVGWDSWQWVLSRHHGDRADLFLRSALRETKNANQTMQPKQVCSPRFHF